ncbi:MAG: WG repeat-containing protein [Bacteroidales bacterium]|nr:WG repeat-containing protein [Bacteroidales bacterium]MDD4001364.1 WG repeat-containing protein [Bacteroidales bacterium]MDD4528843.1 WG repeat-containing protein [Bacteroidales bacterium]MDD4829098.1 WG repeat-containing protein [Bacteroidales bacterium]
MKKIFLFISLFGLSFSLFSQEKELMRELSIKYDSVYDLKELKPSTLFSFTSKGKVGLIDRLGFLVYEPYFESVSAYEVNDVIYIKGKMPNGRMALLNTDGKVLIQPMFEDLFITKEDLLLTMYNNKYGIVNFDGLGYLYPEFDTVKVLIDEDTFFVATIEEKNMVFNTNSEIVEYFDADTLISFVEVLNTSLLPFAWIAEPNCDVVKYLGGGNFYIRNGDKMQILNRQGDQVKEKSIKISAKDVVKFDWYRMLFRVNSLVGMMDYEGNIIVEPKYQDMSVVIEDEVYSYKLNDQWGLMNKDGKILTNSQFEGFHVETYNNVQYIKTKNSNNKTAVLNKRGKPIFQAYYDDIEPANHPNFYNQIQNGGKGIISDKGVMYVMPEFDDVKAYIESDTFFVARRNNRFTIFGTKGDKIYDGLNLIVDIQDSNLTYVEDSKLKKSIIRNNIIQPKSKILNVRYNEIGLAFDSIILVKNSKGWTYANRKTFIPITKQYFDYLTPLHRGYAFAVNGKELFVIDNNYNKVFNIIDSGLIKSELEQLANLLYVSFKKGKSYQYIRKNDKYGVFRLKAIKEVKIKK